MDIELIGSNGKIISNTARHASEGRTCIPSPVNQYTLEGEFIRKWSSAKEAAKALGGRAQNIRLVAGGYNKISIGYLWEYSQKPHNRSH